MFNEFIDSAEIAFEPGVFLLLKAKAKALKAMPEPVPVGDGPEPVPTPKVEPITGAGPEPGPEPTPGAPQKTFHISGNVLPEIWNRLGTKILPKLRSGFDLKIGIDFSVFVESRLARTFETDLKQILEDLGLTGRLDTR